MKHIFKKITAVCLALSLLMLCACQNSGGDEVNIPTTEELLASQYDELYSCLGDRCDTADILSYVKTWAEENGLNIDVDNKGILVISSEPSKNRQDDLSTTLQCSVTGKDNETEMQYVAEMMYILSNCGSHGKLFAIINDESRDSQIPEKYRDTDNFINLYSSEEDVLLNETACSRVYSISKDISWTSPRFSKAYTITVSGLRGGNITDLSEGHPNPVLQLNSIMAKWNTSGYLYDIADFNGGTAAGRYGNSASITVVISENDEEKFLSRVEKQQNSFNKKYGDDEENYEFTVEETAMPDRVLSSESANSVISLLYTMITGEYVPEALLEEDSDEISAYSNIGRFRIKDNAAVLDMQIYSVTDDILSEMDDAVKTIAEISDFNVRVKKTYPHWKENDTDRLAADLAALSEDEPEYVSFFGVTPCTRIYDHNSSTSCLGIAINFDNWDNRADQIISYLKNTDN